MAEPVPMAVPTDESASERWCQALAMTACELYLLPTFAVNWKHHSLSRMLTTAATKAMTPGQGSDAPLTTLMIFSRPPMHIMAPTQSSAMPMSAVARVSYLPCPKSWSLSLGLLLNRTKTSITMSDRKSLSECKASAIMAAEPPNMPAMNLKTSRKTLIKLPSIVTLLIACNRTTFSSFSMISIYLQRFVYIHVLETFLITSCKITLFS